MMLRYCCIMGVCLAAALLFAAAALISMGTVVMSLESVGQSRCKAGDLPFYPD